MSSKYSAYYPSKIGVLKITGGETGIDSLEFMEDNPTVPKDVHPSLQACFDQLDEYFNRKRKTFSLKLNISGTEFQKRVWDQLSKIPYGETVSYLDIATRIGDEHATRAVGNANHNNKIPIIIPCHRIVGKSGKLVGYGGGVWRKEWLLNHEKNVLQQGD